MNVAVQVNADAFNDAVRRYVKEVGVGLPQAMRTQARLLFGRVIQRTYPKTRAQGRRAVARDIRRAVRVLSPGDFESQDLRRMVRRRDYAGLRAVLERSGSPLTVVPFEPDLHRKVRDRRGRVTRPRNVATLDGDAVRSYTRRRQDLVGRAKGGWAAAMRAAGGRPPEWIGRWAAVGNVEDRLADPVAGFIRAENLSEWARHGDDDRIVAGALQSRANDILADIRRRLDRAAGVAANRS